MARGGIMGRRERLRAETTAEIKNVALVLMASGGPDAITLRAIAREMGMTANAIFGYAVPGYHAPDGGAAPDASRRICTGLTALAAAAWPHAKHFYEDSEFDWSDFDAG